MEHIRTPEHNHIFVKLRLIPCHQDGTVMATQILIDPVQALLAAKFIAFAVLGVAVIIVAEHYDWPP